MSTPYPPQPRRLMRDPSNKLIGGVCSGVAKYLNMDVNLVRILTVVIALFTGVPIVLYLIALFVLPEEGAQPPQPPYVNGPPAGNDSAPAGYGQPWQQQTYGQQAPAPAPAADPAASPTPTPTPGPDPVWGAGGAPWEQPQAPASAPTPPPQSPVSGPQTWPAPATAAPEQTPAEAPAAEPLPETEVIEVPAEETSTWESAPAEPVSSEPVSSETGSTEAGSTEAVEEGEPVTDERPEEDKPQA